MILDLFSAEQLDGNRTGTLTSINLSGGGVPKKPTTVAQVSLLRVEGDAQRDLRYHGGPERAVCLYSLERIQALKAEGHPIDVGTAGENLTVSGVDWNLVVPGAKVKIGSEVALEIASFTKPCKTIRESFLEGKFVRISQKLHPGWSRVYARVLTAGRIESGDRVEVVPTGG
jgi:MOSC domain-containing protein YiiM